MYNAEKGNPKIKEEVLTQCWQYLHENFHKFNETNKIKIALELTKKNLPTEITGNLNVTMMGTVKIGDKPLEIDIG